MESKRRHRLSRNKRKRQEKKQEKKQVKKGLTALVQGLQEENKCLSQKVKVQTAIKEKYFEMWRVSEKEKDKIKNAKLVFHGASNQMPSNKENEILKINPSLLEEVEGTGEIGKGKFGTVYLKKFRSSPVAVKYFEACTSAKVVEKEACYVSKCCHINLPLLYGMNITEKPYFIVTQYYGNESFQPVTLHKIISQDKAVVPIPDYEHWLHIITQLIDGLCYLHAKGILHNDIKNDNIVIICSSKGLFSPVLVDYGKACLVNEGKRKILSRNEKAKYYKEHYHIAPEVIERTHPQSIKSDMYSVGVVVASLYKHSKYLPLKEIAKHCLKPFSTRCTSAELFSIVFNLPVEQLK